eukprot:EC687313.1.p1 GENE.EC687313.1~~EC687313.1.p1  ORF type:complete len:140 (-),score=39.25 EC687313.1:114-533(-)
MEETSQRVASDENSGESTRGCSHEALHHQRKQGETMIAHRDGFERGHILHERRHERVNHLLDAVRIVRHGEIPPEGTVEALHGLHPLVRVLVIALPIRFTLQACLNALPQRRRLDLQRTAHCTLESTAHTHAHAPTGAQ